MSRCYSHHHCTPDTCSYELRQRKVALRSLEQERLLSLVKKHYTHMILPNGESQHIDFEQLHNNTHYNFDYDTDQGYSLVRTGPEEIQLGCDYGNGGSLSTFTKVDNCQCIECIIPTEIELWVAVRVSDGYIGSHYTTAAEVRLLHPDGSFIPVRVTGSYVLTK